SIDSDTIYPPDYVENVVNAFEKTNPVAVNMSYNYIYYSKKDKFKYSIYYFFRNIFNRL
ncbi:MAG TPA: glycosyl transferase family A, partial [Bacteroidales bacterium]|nr:glycosyl transferase family A [Bacteroidales bacterium]